MGASDVQVDVGMVVAGQPHIAAAWFPANNHPRDQASFTFRVTVPEGRTAIANGELEDKKTENGWTTWTWRAREPLAPYLATTTIGSFDLRSYEHDGIRFWDAIDTVLDHRFTPHTGKRFAISAKDTSSFQRLTRTIPVPAKGGKLSFSIDRNTEANWDHVFVEARTAGENDWTTLRDLNGHTKNSTGSSCPFWLEMHPFLEHYQKAKPGGDGCESKGSTGRWWSASGASYGWERWSVDLRGFAGKDAEVSISYASDDLFQAPGVVVDDISGPGGAGSTSFEQDDDPMDGWRAGPTPKGSTSTKTWTAGDAGDAPPPLGPTARRSLARQGEMIDFLSDLFGPYPFSAAGGIVHKAAAGFALETQTRSTYAASVFADSENGDLTVVHETAHQWVGDSLTVDAWRHVWLNEGFATYTEWLWSEREKIKDIDTSFAEAYKPDAKDPSWKTKVGAPGAEDILSGPIYNRGAMTLHELRRTIGDDDFFRLLRKWTVTRGGSLVTTEDFVDLAEDVSGQDLGKFFQAWLFTGKKPALAPRPGTATN